MEIPYRELSKSALTGIIEEYVSREGTDYGEREYSFEQKVEQVRRQIVRGEILINFDETTESCNLVPREQMI